MEEQQEKEELRQLAQCLKDFLGLDRMYTNPYAILSFLADQTIKNIEANRHTSFKSAEIAKTVSNGNSEPSAWLSQYWKKIDRDLKQLHINGLSEFALKRGLKKYPWVTKIESPGGAGHQAQYLITGIEIDKSIVVKSDRFSDVPFDIEYVAVQDIKPSFIARFIFNTNHSAIGWRKWLLVFYPMLEMVAFSLMGSVLILGFFMGNHAITSRDLVYLIFIYFTFLLCKHAYQRSHAFLNDRIIMASDHFMSFKENNIVQELVTVNNDQGDFLYKKVQLTKYVGICPICSAQVVLEKGEPDFSKRVVGRCKESPREHVYSFDRTMKKGNKLV
jgi:hypothetical protein